MCFSFRVVFYASEEVLSPFQDQSCFDNCYEPCGEIYHPDGFDYKGENVIVRAFHLNLADLHKYVAQDTRRVYVHAQTVVITDDIDVDYALSIRARQLILDRSQSYHINIHTLAPDLDLEEEATLRYGPEPDSLFMKQSVMCARILLDTKQQEHVNTSWAILHDIATAQGLHEESNRLAASIRTLSGQFSGIDFSNTKTHIVEILENYYERISTYKLDLDRIMDR